MVKITDPKQDKNNNIDMGNIKVDDIIDLKTNQKITPELLKELLKPRSKQETISTTVRLEKNLSNQIDLYAKQHHTTKTEVIKEIINNYYTGKKVNQVTYDLEDPVTLIIPKSKTLINKYIEKNVNILSSIKGIDDHNIINPLDPHKNLFNTKEYELIQVTQVNNILDEHDPNGKCYSFISLPKYMDKFYPALYELILEDVIDETGNTNDYYRNMIHRGLLLVPVVDTEETTAGLFIDIISMGNQLLGAYIITPEEAIQLATDTGNDELIKFIHEIDTHITLTDLLEESITTEELLQQNTKLNEDIKKLMDTNKVLKDKNKKLTKSLEKEYQLNKELSFKLDKQNNTCINTDNEEKERKKLKVKIDMDKAKLPDVFTEDKEKENLQLKIDELNKQLEIYKEKDKQMQDNLRKLHDILTK